MKITSTYGRCAFALREYGSCFSLKVLRGSWETNIKR